MKTFATYLESLNQNDSFSAYAECMGFTNNNGKRFLLLYDDVYTCLRSIWKFGFKIENDLNGNWEYEEEKYRKILGDVFKDIEANTVATNLGSQTANTVKSLDLYAGFLLNKNPQKNGRFPFFLKHRDLSEVFSAKDDFRKWILLKGKSESSAVSFAGAISPTISKIIGFDLFSVSTVDEIIQIRNTLTNNSEFSELDSRGNQMYSGALNHFQDFVASRGIKSIFMMPPTKETLTKNLVISALTKPFVILTGASGTGKTKLAESVAHYLANADSSNFKIVPVGADWTDNRHVLGFVNHLRDDGTDGKRPIYQTTDILDLLLEASENKDVPYFLILDEMNLSHVERYFADFLSVMERSGGRISLHKEGSGDNAESRLLRHPDDKLGVPQAIDYPQNLFVIGTVNIDETTYMFSPKVLDRATVIEFKVGTEAIGSYLENPAGYPEMNRAADGVAKVFLELSLNARADGLAAMDVGLKKVLNQHLLEIFGIMEKGRYEFAYRTINEVIRYLKVCHELAEDKKAWMDGEWKADFDAQILQKILPKLHGSIGRISDLIVGLAHYCYRGELPSEAAPAFSKLKDVVGLDSKDATFSQSFKKLQAMAATLQSEQFVSFIR